MGLMRATEQKKGRPRHAAFPGLRTLSLGSKSMTPGLQVQKYDAYLVANSRQVGPITALLWAIWSPRIGSAYPEACST